MAFTNSSLLRFLLSLVTRLRSSVGRISVALGTRFASFWRSILTLGSYRRRSHIRLHANDVLASSNSPAGGIVQHETPATSGRGPIVRLAAPWQDTLALYQALISSHKFEFKPVPATPETGSQRYKPRIVKRDVDTPPISPGQKKLLAALPQLPNEWKRHVHPEGNVIFYHEGLRIFTENDIFHCEKDILVCATQLIQQAIQMVDYIELDEFTGIVINLDKNYCHYYFVDHTHRLLFWLVPWEVNELGAQLEGITEYSHIRYMVKCIVYHMESRSHCEYYPHNRTLPKVIFEDLRGMLNYAKTDMMTTDSSSSPFGQDELVAILDLVNSLKDDEKISDQYSIWVIARIMVFFTEIQVSNFYGQPCARLDADTPLFGKPLWNHSPLFRAINLFLFGSPNEHALRLQRVWVDGIIIQPRWKDFISRLTSELGRYTIFSTVMLAVNFSFLAVPGVVNSAPGSVVGPIQIIIYCSIVSTTASIIFSFALLNVYSDPGLLIAASAAVSMRILSETKAGMACLAITHSLPIASLVWSIALFSAALAVQIFGPKDTATVASLGAECFIIVLFAGASYWITHLLSSNDDGDESAEGLTSESSAGPLADDVELGTV